MRRLIGTRPVGCAGPWRGGNSCAGVAQAANQVNSTQTHPPPQCPAGSQPQCATRQRSSQTLPGPPPRLHPSSPCYPPARGGGGPRGRAARAPTHRPAALPRRQGTPPPPPRMPAAGAAHMERPPAAAPRPDTAARKARKRRAARVANRRVSSARTQQQKQQRQPAAHDAVAHIRPN